MFKHTPRPLQILADQYSLVDPQIRDRYRVFSFTESEALGLLGFLIPAADGPSQAGHLEDVPPGSVLRAMAYDDSMRLLLLAVHHPSFQPIAPGAQPRYEPGKLKVSTTRGTEAAPPPAPPSRNAKIPWEFLGPPRA